MKPIINFCIVAHIDHGKSTLADRLMEITGTVAERDLKQQTLDSMDLEREKGITIKATPVRLEYSHDNGKSYIMNLIDTPGHVDFSYEVSRAISACEAAILIVDATQGIQAQTLANVFMAMERNLVIIPVINKIDLPTSDISNVKRSIEEVLAIDSSECLYCSAKTGEGVEEVLKALVSRVPVARQNISSVFQALIFDSVYSSYRGAMPYIKVISGSVARGDKIKLLATGESFEVLEVGVFCPEMKKVASLGAGEVGYLVANVRNPDQINIGDTVVHKTDVKTLPLEGFNFIQPVVYSGIYPVDSSEFDLLQSALNKLKLNDSALAYSKESSVALGFGFRCGFLGLLHLEIVTERLIREFGVQVIMCSPSVAYVCELKSGESVKVHSPAFMPERFFIYKIKEPWVISRLMIPAEYLGAIMSLALEKRGICISTDSMDENRLILTYHFPMNEILMDLNDKLKSITKGFGSFDYSILDYRYGDVVKMTILLNGAVVDAFTSIVHRGVAERRGRFLCKKLAESIPRSLLKVIIQAAADGKIVARTTISALQKDVTAKCYGGDISRKYKLWNKQKEGKKKMRKFGTINVPHEVFIKIIKEKFI